MQERVKRARTAIKSGDYAAAHEIAADVARGSTLQNWRYYPFSDFIRALANANDPALAKQLDAWVDRTRRDPIPPLIRAQYHHNMGWFRRGHGFTRETPYEQQVAFYNHMRQALFDVDTAITADDGNPYGFLLKLNILRGLGLSDDVKSTFEAAIARHPHYYPLYDTVLSMLQPKWGGSISAMYDFVDRFGGQAATHSPLKLLYLSLYRYLLNAAYIECWSYRGDKDGRIRCTARAMDSKVRPGLEDSVQSALQLYDHLDKYQFGLAVEEILNDMLRTRGADVHSQKILEWAASSMHSDTQLRREKPGHNNYVIDKLVAASWYRQGFYENVLLKNRQAIEDIDAATFPSAAEKDLAIAGVYDSFARAHNKLHQYSDIISYQKAAIALGGTTDQAHFICYAYYRLKAYDEASRACTEAIEDRADNMKAYYWRGRLHTDAAQSEAALRDLAAVADSEDGFRASAAIGMSMIHFGRKDVRAALDVLNKYTYLYNPDRTAHTNVAVAYNNRCYAHMQLGELKKALDDCNASLKYDGLPDAYRKQQELMKRLGVREQPTLWQSIAERLGFGDLLGNKRGGAAN